MHQLGNESERTNGSYFRRILHKALPSLSNRELQYSNRTMIADRYVHPLNRLPRRRKKRKRRKNRMPSNVLANPTTVIYCTCGGQTLTPSNVIATKPCRSVPLKTLRICLSEVSERRRFLGEPRRTVKSVLRVKETHEIAEAQLRKNEKLREAFGISEYFVEGSSFDPERHAKEAAAKAALEETQKYALIPSPPSSEDESTPAEKPAESSKSKKKKKASASPPDPSTTNVKKKKKKKHKRKSESPVNEEKVSGRHKSKAEKDVKKKRHASASPPKNNKHRKRNEESSDVELKKTKKKKSEKHIEERTHKSRISRSPSPYRSDVDSDDYKCSRKKKRPAEVAKTTDKKKRSSSRSKARVQETDNSLATEYDHRKKKRSPLRSKARKYDREESPPTSEYERKKKYTASSRSKPRKHDKSRSPTPDSSVERSPEVDYRDERTKHSRNRSKERQRKREKEAEPRKHPSSKRKASPVDSDEDDFKEPKISDRRSKMGRSKEQRSRSKEERSRSTEKRSRSSEKRSRSKDESSRSKEGRSRSKKSSPDRRPKRRSSSTERRRESEYRSELSSAKRKRRDSSSEREFVEKQSRRDDSREKSSRKRESQLAAASRVTTPSKPVDSRHSKPVKEVQRNDVEAAPAVENGVNADASVTNRDSSTSSSLSYSPMEKYPHRYKDILADALKKGQKYDLSLRRSETKDRSSPAKGDDRSKKEKEVKPPDTKEKLQTVLTKNAAPPSASKSENVFCVGEVPLPPIGDSSFTMKLPAPREGDKAAESPKKAAKLIDSTLALVKSIPPALTQKSNTLASSISDVIAKSMQKRDASSSSESLRKRKSRSSSSSSSSDSSLSSRKRSGSDSSSSSSRSSSSSSSSSSRGSSRRRRSRKQSSASDRSSSSSSSDSSRSSSRDRSVTKNKRKKKKRGARSASHSDSRSYSSSYSSSRSRSISIPRRKGSPSFLERRRITSARKRPVPYQRSSVLRSSSPGSSDSTSRASSMSRHSRGSSPASRHSRISSYLPARKRSPSFRTPSPSSRSPFRWGSRTEKCNRI